ncbi:hypothetical protein Cgig2_033834 [Carnegiea gigantea]|uniref:RRM domain-containing protein n=1 Tax=Carnegiea gigantea TaxID=171969 RepID=A0A9Q1Q6E4_9CARY|nr:hypothetical protein Cgig2_033834 [Carnegiea gigantea]
MVYSARFCRSGQHRAAGKGPRYASRPPPDHRIRSSRPPALSIVQWLSLPQTGWMFRAVSRQTKGCGRWHGMRQAKHSTIDESRGNQTQIFSIFIDNLPINLDNLGLKQLFSSYGEVVDVYIPSKVGRKSGQKYGFITLDEFYHDKSATAALNGETVKGYKLEIAWTKFQKRSSLRPSKQREEPQKKMVWKWIPKKNLTSISNEAPKALEDNQQLASPYKQALLSYLNSNKLEAPNGNLEAVGNDVHEGLSDNSKTITQPLDDAHNRPIFVRKFPSQAPRSSMEDNEDINIPLRDIQLHEKREMTKCSNKGKKSGNRNSRSIHNSPPRLK